jgi:hypothetical protein
MDKMDMQRSALFIKTLVPYLLTVKNVVLWTSFF